MFALPKSFHQWSVCQRLIKLFFTGWGKKLIFSKKNVVLAMFLLCTLFVAYAQEQNASSESQIQFQQSENQISVEESLPIQAENSQLSSSRHTASTFFTFFRMIVVLLFVVACMYAVIRFMKNGLQSPESNDPFLRKVSSVSISPGKSVQVVTLLDKAYIIGVGESSINLIGEVQDKELIDAMNLYADKNNSSSKPRNFNDILALFMPNSAENKNVFKSSATKASELLKKQRERLENNENQ